MTLWMAPLGLTAMAAAAALPVVLLGGETGIGGGAAAVIGSAIALAYLVPIVLTLWVSERVEEENSWRVTEENPWT